MNGITADILYNRIKHLFIPFNEMLYSFKIPYYNLYDEPR